MKTPASSMADLLALLGGGFLTYTSSPTGRELSGPRQVVRLARHALTVEERRARMRRQVKELVG